MILAAASLYPVLSYSKTMPHCDVVIQHGGHGGKVGARFAVVQHLGLALLLHLFLALFDQAFHALALLAGHLHLEVLADLVQPLDLATGFLEVPLEGATQLRR